MSGRNYRDLIAWRKSMDFVEAVYRTTAAFPREEVYGLISQMRRAAVSIPCNIAEGQGRDSSREFHRFLSVAHGSLREVETQVLIAERLKYVNTDTGAKLMESAGEIGRLLNGLMNSLARRP
jgi:four helix bundle protein